MKFFLTNGFEYEALIRAASEDEALEIYNRDVSEETGGGFKAISRDEALVRIARCRNEDSGKLFLVNECLEIIDDIVPELILCEEI